MNICPTHPVVAYIFQSVKKKLADKLTNIDIPVTGLLAVLKKINADLNHTRQDLLSFFPVFFQNCNQNSVFFFVSDITFLHTLQQPGTLVQYNNVTVDRKYLNILSVSEQNELSKFAFSKVRT